MLTGYKCNLSKESLNRQRNKTCPPPRERFAPNPAKRASNQSDRPVEAVMTTPMQQLLMISA